MSFLFCVMLMVVVGVLNNISEKKESYGVFAIAQRSRVYRNPGRILFAENLGGFLEIGSVFGSSNIVACCWCLCCLFNNIICKTMMWCVGYDAARGLEGY